MSILDNEGHDPNGLGNTPSRSEIDQLRAALDNERAAHAVACQMRDEAVQIQRNASVALDELREESERLRAELWHVREDMAQLVQQVDKALEQKTDT